jgi:hypothetical protein
MTEAAVCHFFVGVAKGLWGSRRRRGRSDDGSNNVVLWGLGGGQRNKSEGRTTQGVVVSAKTTMTTSGISPLPTLLGQGQQATDTAILPYPPTEDKIDYSDKDGGQSHKRGGADDDNKQQEQLLDRSGQPDMARNYEKA